MKTQHELLTLMNSKWAIIDSKGKILETFNLKTTANQWIPRMKINRQEKLTVVELKKEQENK